MLQLYGKWSLYPNRVGYKTVMRILLHNCPGAFDFCICTCPWNEKRFSKRAQSAHCLFHTFVVLHVPYYFIWIYEYFIILSLSTDFMFIVSDSTLYFASPQCLWLLSYTRWLRSNVQWYLWFVSWMQFMFFTDSLISAVRPRNEGDICVVTATMYDFYEKFSWKILHFFNVY